MIYIEIVPGAEAWLLSAGFKDYSVNSTYERIYAHTSGHGYITVRFMPNAMGWDAIVETGHGEDRRGFNLGTCKTLEQMQAVWSSLKALEYVSSSSEPIKRNLQIEWNSSNML